MSENNKDTPARIKLCGLWKQKTRDGKVYYSGGFGYGAGLQLFTNAYKEGDPKKPDLILYVVKKKPKEEKNEDRPKGKTEEEWEDEGEVPF